MRFKNIVICAFTLWMTPFCLAFSAPRRLETLFLGLSDRLSPAEASQG